MPDKLATDVRIANTRARRGGRPPAGFAGNRALRAARARGCAPPGRFSSAPANAPVFGVYTWHSGVHGNQSRDGALNQCQLCHPDASGSGGLGTAIADPARHANGSVNVVGRFTNACFGCH
jgi:hypothetical protein